MRNITISVSSADKKYLRQHGVGVATCESLLNLVVNHIKPCSKHVDHLITIKLCGGDTSYYPFDSTLHITKENFKPVSIKQRHLNFFDDLLHEFGHYIQFRIDRVPFKLFAVDYDEISWTRYYNNVTERQARKYGKLSQKFVNLVMQMNKLQLTCSQPLSMVDGKEKTSEKDKKRKGKEDNQNTAVRDTQATC